MTIAAQMQEMLFDDDRTCEQLSEQFKITRQAINDIKRGAAVCSTRLAVAYLDDLGWEWKIRGRAYRGHPGKALLQYITDNKGTMTRLVKEGIIDDRTATKIKRQPETIRTQTIDRLSEVLGLTWITVKKEEVVA